jgi:hypothetical protein
MHPILQETSFRCGLAYIIAIVAEFDEYSNDILNPFVQVFSFRLSANVVAKLHRDQNGITNNESVDSQAQISKDIGELSGGGCSSKV